MVENLQRLQTPNTLALSNGTGDERNERRARLTEPCDPTYTSRQNPAWKNTSGMIDDNRIDGSEYEANQGNGDATSDK